MSDEKNKCRIQDSGFRILNERQNAEVRSIEENL